MSVKKEKNVSSSLINDRGHIVLHLVIPRRSLDVEITGNERITFGAYVPIDVFMNGRHCVVIAETGGCYNMDIKIVYVSKKRVFVIAECHGWDWCNSRPFKKNDGEYVYGNNYSLQRYDAFNKCLEKFDTSIAARGVFLLKPVIYVDQNETIKNRDILCYLYNKDQFLSMIDASKTYSVNALAKSMTNHNSMRYDSVKKKADAIGNHVITISDKIRTVLTEYGSRND